jgi:hypothetical protein
LFNVSNGYYYINLHFNNWSGINFYVNNGTSFNLASDQVIVNSFSEYNFSYLANTTIYIVGVADSSSGVTSPYGTFSYSIYNTQVAVTNITNATVVNNTIVSNTTTTNATTTQSSSSPVYKPQTGSLILVCCVFVGIICYIVLELKYPSKEPRDEKEYYD